MQTRIWDQESSVHHENVRLNQLYGSPQNFFSYVAFCFFLLPMSAIDISNVWNCMILRVTPVVSNGRFWWDANFLYSGEK